jgi:hypothetical protein
MSRRPCCTSTLEAAGVLDTDVVLVASLEDVAKDDMPFGVFVAMLLGKRVADFAYLRFPSASASISTRYLPAHNRCLGVFCQLHLFRNMLGMRVFSKWLARALGPSGFLAYPSLSRGLAARPQCWAFANAHARVDRGRSSMGHVFVMPLPSFKTLVF